MRQAVYSIELIIQVLENWTDITAGNLPVVGGAGSSLNKKNPMEGWLALLADVNKAISHLAISYGVRDRWADICQLQPKDCRKWCKELTPAQQRVVRVYIFGETYRGYWKDDCWGILGRMKRFLNGQPEQVNSHQHAASIERGLKIIQGQAE